MFDAPHIEGGISDAFVRAAVAALPRKQLDALARYLHDGSTQQQIGDETSVRQSTVQKRIALARQRLAKVGVTLRLPGRGRRPGRTATVDPASLDALSLDRDGDDYTTGRSSIGYTPGVWQSQHHR